jgi:hypothetical protein
LTRFLHLAHERVDQFRPPRPPDGPHCGPRYAGAPPSDPHPPTPPPNAPSPWLRMLPRLP